MRILCLGGPMLAEAFRRSGHTVLTAGTGGELDAVIRHPVTTAHLLERLGAAGFAPDVLFYCDNGNLPLLLDPQRMPVPSVWYSIDTYCNPWHVPYACGFDLALAAQKDFVPLFAHEGIPVRWLPLFCPAPLDENAAAGERDIPVAFVGTLGHRNNPDRKPFVDAFRRRHPLVLRSGAYAPVFARSHIVLNQTAFSEVNFRCFEAAGCGAALLMETCGNGLEELFTPGEEILPTYPRGDAAAAARIAAQALAEPARLAEIARAGFAAVRARHSADIRAVALVELFASLLADRVHETRLSCNTERRETLVRGAFGVLASELDNPDMTAHRAFFADIACGRIPAAGVRSS